MEAKNTLIDILPWVNSQMMPIPEGSITLRDDRIKQAWLVKIKPFKMAQFPVTQQLYFTVTQERPSHFIGDQKPVETVSWMDAARFCNLLSIKANLQPCYVINGDEISFNAAAQGYRLPTEAEWQYACQAGTEGIRYGELDNIAWYKANACKQTQEVGQKEPNAWGLYDMLGNVWEWCADVYDSEVYGAYRVLRGGGWCDEERGCMATNRRRSHPISFKIDDLGFRIAQSI